MTDQAVIVDYGRVLARTLDAQPRTRWERKLGLAAGGLERMVHNEGSWVAAQRGHIAPETHWHDVALTLGLTPAEGAMLRADFYKGDVVNAELVARLDQLRAAGVRTALLSNFSLELRHLLTAQELLQRFDQLVISAEIGVMKPASAAYRAILDKLTLPAQVCVFIDDQPANVEAAQALGLHGIVFRDNATCLAQLDDWLSATR